jgi:hypothetical protein
MVFLEAQDLPVGMASTLSYDFRLTALWSGELLAGAFPLQEPDALLRARLLGCKGSLADFLHLTEFRSLVHELLAKPASGALLRQKVAMAICNATEPGRYIDELLTPCVRAGGPDALNVGIDVLSLVGEPLLSYVTAFLSRDADRWSQRDARPHPNDDAWYILARAFARSDSVPESIKVALLRVGLAGTPSMREATVHALGDLGGPAAVKLLRKAQGDSDAMVRESACEVLADLEK